jgi:hypothetical protein
VAELTFRPLLTRWPKPETPANDRIRAKWEFKGGVKVWIDHLVRELDLLQVREALIELDAPPASFKKWGGLFADAPTTSPRVMVTFDLPDVGTVVYACDTYRAWEWNLRGIGLTLERLRLVDGYGATTGHQQYHGFKRLPGAGESSVVREMTPQEAAALVVGLDPQWAKFDAAVRRSIEDNVLAAADVAKSIILAAVKVTHPDAGGTAEAFAGVQRARAAIGKHHGAEL